MGLTLPWEKNVPKFGSHNRKGTPSRPHQMKFFRRQDSQYASPIRPDGIRCDWQEAIFQKVWPCRFLKLKASILNCTWKQINSQCRSQNRDVACAILWAHKTVHGAAFCTQLKLLDSLQGKPHAL